MSVVYEIIASEADRRAYYAVASRAFGTSKSLHYAQALRLRLARFRVADHWVIRVDGELGRRR